MGDKQPPRPKQPTTPANRIKAARALRGMEQKDLAARANVSVFHLCNIERGHREIDTLKVATLRRICDALEVSMDYVVADK